MVYKVIDRYILRTSSISRNIKIITNCICKESRTANVDLVLLILHSFVSKIQCFSLRTFTWTILIYLILLRILVNHYSASSWFFFFSNDVIKFQTCDTNLPSLYCRIEGHTSFIVIFTRKVHVEHRFNIQDAL